VFEFIICKKAKDKPNYREIVVDGRGKEFVSSRDEVLLRHAGEITEHGGPDGQGVAIVLVPFREVATPKKEKSQ
jgi:hypothetical protein